MSGLVVLVATAGPASAHAVSGQNATNIRSRVDVVSPVVSGLSVRIVELGGRIEVRWTGVDDLIVPGYDGEPYLRIGPSGIFRNRLSPATYLNVVRGLVTIPSGVTVDTKAPPQWVKIGTGRRALWHDHRIHYMGGPLPQVSRAPGSFHVLQTWTIALTEGGRTITVMGEYDWVPQPSALPWTVVIVALVLFGALAGVGRWWAPVLAGLTALVVVADVVHVVGIGLESVGSAGHRIVVMIGGSYYSIVAWGLGAVAIALLARRSADGLFAAVFSGLVIGLFGGLTDVGWLSHSQVPFAFGTGLARVLVAASIGGGGGLITGSIVALRRNRPRPTAHAPA
ncbi:MAG: hypothetical protein ACYDH6_02690 [Acidimicrobiales bacterium]